MLAPFAHEEELSGALSLSIAPERPLPISVRLHSLRRWLLPPRGPIEVHGTVHAPGFATRKPLWGWVDRSRLSTRPGAYRLELSADDGSRVRLLAQRQTSLSEPLLALSSVHGTLLGADGSRLGTVELRIDYKQRLGGWLAH